jgi:hypothetical protein
MHHAQTSGKTFDIPVGKLRRSTLLQLYTLPKKADGRKIIRISTPSIGCNNCNLCDPNTNPICWQGFGPDIAYDDCALGLSSNATYNPNQATYSPYRNGGTGANNGYMRKGLREWMVWYKKQTGFDGIRIDAVKHFQNEVSRDFLFNLQNLADWASATDTMFAVGEWVGGKTDLDNWTLAVEERIRNL